MFRGNPPTRCNACAAIYCLWIIWLLAVGCVVIAGLIEGAQQALISAPNVSSILPKVMTSPTSTICRLAS